MSTSHPDFFKRMMDSIKEIKKLLSFPKDVVITTHRNPDGDAIGSSLGLMHYLKKLGHNVKIVSPSDYPMILSWMPEIDSIVVYDNEVEESKAIIEQAELFFCLDFNSLDRIDKVGELIAAKNCPKVMIDHHLDPEPFVDHAISNSSASSTCELVYEVICLLGDKALVDVTVGEALFTGILTDTGSFKYSTSGKLFAIVSELLDIGVDDYKLQDLIFNSLSAKHLRLLGHCLYNRMEILDEYKTGIIVLTKEDYANFDIQRGDTEGIVNYLLKIKDIKMAAFITEQPTIVKISLRSKGDFSVQEIAMKHFKGGGHRNASGGASFKSLRSTVKRFKELLPEYKELLNQ